MGGHHASFSLFPRSNGIFSFQIWNPEERRYEVARSTGTRNRAKAKVLAAKYLEQHRQVALAPTNPLFVDYLLETWNWESSPYVRAKLLRRPDGLTKAYVQTSLSFCRRYANPFFINRKLSEITSRELEQFLLTLRDTTSLAPKSINAVYDATAIPLREAFRLGMIPLDPTQAIRKLWVPYNEKGIPTLSELQAVLAHVRAEPRIEAACLLAAICGLRLGEIRALQAMDIRSDFLSVKHSFSVVDGLKAPKNGHPRVVPLPAFLRDKLATSLLANPHRGTWIFWGKVPDVPVSPGFIEYGFNKALEKIGITEQERKQRNLTFHSLRHYCNAMLRGAVSDEKLRLLTGHSSVEMTNRYDHVTSLDLELLKEAQETRIISALELSA